MMRTYNNIKCYRVVKVYPVNNHYKRARGSKLLVGRRVYDVLKPSFAWAYDLAIKENKGIWTGMDPDGSLWAWDINEVYYDDYERSAMEDF